MNEKEGNIIEEVTPTLVKPQSRVFQMISDLGLLMFKAGWAPIAVLILHDAIQETTLRKPLDFPIHFLGGASIAFFFFHALNIFKELVGAWTPFGRYLFSFALACTIGLFWEFAELFSDVFCHTHIQKSVHETMSDLIADASGAITSLSISFFVIRFFGRRRSQTKPVSEIPIG